MVKGLCNFGATCYFNTAIQCLYASPHFRNYVLSETRRSELFDKLKELFIELGNDASPLKFILPKPLLQQVNHAMGNLIDINEQNDINEFLSIFLDKLNQSIAYTVDVPPSKSKESSYHALAHRLDRAWIQSHYKEWSDMLDVTHGQVIHQVSCGHCHKKHHNYEVFTNIPLSMADKKKGTLLEELIDDHFKDHFINMNTDDDEVKWKCDKCHQTKCSTASSCLWRLPHLLVFSLKRFDEKLNKNNVQLSINETLNMQRWVLKKDEHTKYRLVAVAVHMGSFFGGHYFAIARHDETWYKIDDESVFEISGPQLSEHVCNGYLYFYERLQSAENT